MTVKEVAAFLRAHDSYLILTHRRPDGDTLGCAAALCAMLRQMGKTAALLPNAEVTSLYADYVAPYWAAEDYRYETVVSVDLAALGLFPDNAERLRTGSILPSTTIRAMRASEGKAASTRSVPPAAKFSMNWRSSWDSSPLPSPCRSTSRSVRTRAASSTPT